MIKCKVCEIEKEDKFFYRVKNNKSGLSKSCKKCDNIYRKKYPQNTLSKDSGLFAKYKGARERCYLKSNVSYKWYGGKGIKVLWDSYLEFKNDMYESYLSHIEKYGRKNTSLDRIDSNGNYCKENCRWATWHEQACNRNSERYIIFKGEIAREASIRLGGCRDLVATRIRNGWNMENAFTTPMLRRKKPTNFKKSGV